MWEFEKRLQYPVRIRHTDARAAKIIITQYGGPDGELGASLRYLSQRFSMPDPRVAGLLTDIGTEELAHLEMIGAIVEQLTANLTVDEIKAQGFRIISLITRSAFIRRRREDFPLLPPRSLQRAIRSPTSAKIWARNRKQGRPMIISSVLSTIPT